MSFRVIGILLFGLCLNGMADAPTAGEFDDPIECYRLLRGLADDPYHAKALLDPKIQFGDRWFEMYRERLRRIARARRDASKSPRGKIVDLDFLLQTGDSFMVHFPGHFKSHTRLRVTQFESPHYFHNIYMPGRLEGPRRDLVIAAGIPWDENGPARFEEFIASHPEQRAKYLALGSQLAASGDAKYVALIKEWMDWYLSRTGAHRWPPQMREELERIAFELRDRSVWIVVRKKKPDGTPGDIEMTLRLITSHTGVLGVKKPDRVVEVHCNPSACKKGVLFAPNPLPIDIISGQTAFVPAAETIIFNEDLLGVGSTYGEYVRIEPGSWGIAFGSNKVGTAATFLHMLAYATKYCEVLGLNPDSIVFDTWADSVSQPVFERYGFNLLLDNEGDPVTFDRFGIRWKGMRMVLGQLSRVVAWMEMFRPNWTEPEGEDLNRLFREVIHRRGERRYLDIDLE